ncbi:MAG: hypothetical protein M1832_006027 [Thelocarpon impressellum]|nr:MAG: hypothetical protein M1832_006027 [Thelocarpon impressellum]
MADDAHCHKWISRKVKDYDRMLADATLTPRLEDRLEQAKNVFESALKLQNTPMVSLTRSLRKMDRDIEAIYASTFGSIEKSAELLLHLTAVRGFMRGLLFDDYGQNPAHSVRKSLNIHDFVITGRILAGPKGRVQVAREYGRPEVDDPRVTETMRQRLEDCCREMLLEPEELTAQFVEFAARNGRRRDRVQELVDACKWAELAQKLGKDRVDLMRIVPRKERMGKRGTGEWHEEIFDRIAAIEEMYFDSIQAPCKPNVRARRMSHRLSHRARASDPTFRRTQSVNDISKLQPERPLPPVPVVDYDAKTSPYEEMARLSRGEDDGDAPPPRYSELPGRRDMRATQRRSLPGLVGRLFGNRR